MYIGGWVIGCKCTRDEYGQRSVVKSTECISAGGELHSKRYSWMTYDSNQSTWEDKIAG